MANLFWLLGMLSFAVCSPDIALPVFFILMVLCWRYAD